VKARGRAVTNEAELAEVATDFGFESVDPGSMTQQQQRKLFGEAKVVCGPVGAAMTNILYMPSGSEVICLGPLENTRTFFPGLTVGQEIAFKWVLGNYDPEFLNSRRFPHLPYSVRRLDLERALRST
jgi:capsular polysaccharide biosynthesis protein